MENIKIKLGAITDIITNSSSVIYTYSDHSGEACKKMVEAILTAIGSDKTCDEMFDIYVSADTEQIVEWIDTAIDEYRDEDESEKEEKLLAELPKNWTELEWDEREKFILNVQSLIAKGSIKKPWWLVEALKGYDHRAETHLYITPKDPKYQDAANLIRKFLYSTISVEGYNG